MQAQNHRQRRTITHFGNLEVAEFKFFDDEIHMVFNLIPRRWETTHDIAALRVQFWYYVFRDWKAGDMIPNPPPIHIPTPQEVRLTNVATIELANGVHADPNTPAESEHLDYQYC
ncbi:hypothetical protein C8034_v005953 [Colletotrichum sidae]|uniref:Uncharacterized protein n=1 Tax=Colletotrichum sidae TaxID=1347389 RepID=A0A4R8T532_9PEZI|nr:hypothetical protein C8034_v005953 [Colletotrichum sidae]